MTQHSAVNMQLHDICLRSLRWSLSASQLTCRANMLATRRSFNRCKHWSGEVINQCLHPLQSRAYLLFLVMTGVSLLADVFLHYRTPGCRTRTRRTTEVTVLLYFAPNFSTMPAHHFSHHKFLVYTSTQPTCSRFRQSERRIFGFDQ